MTILNGRGGNHQKLPSSFLCLLVKVFCIGLTLGSGFDYVSKQAPFIIQQKDQKNIGQAEYLRLEPKMTLAQVESILGRGIEIQRSETTAKYVWKNPNLSGIIVLFKNGKLSEKTQVNRL